MTKTKTILIASLFTMPTLFARDIQQQKDISKVVKELTYLIQVTKQLQYKYREDNSKIRFNYNAFISQLEADKAAAQEYLNQELYELHTAPPEVVKPQVTRVKP